MSFTQIVNLSSVNPRWDCTPPADFSFFHKFLSKKILNFSKFSLSRTCQMLTGTFLIKIYVFIHISVRWSTILAERTKGKFPRTVINILSFWEQRVAELARSGFCCELLRDAPRQNRGIFFLFIICEMRECRTKTICSELS